MRNSQRGDSKFGCVIWLVVLAVAAAIGWEYIPQKIKVSQLEDFMVEQTKFAANLKPEQIQKNIMGKVEELELPVDKQNLRVGIAGGKIKIECNYEIPLKFPGYTYLWQVEHSVERPIFIF
jgi:hypothetical protein